MTVRELIDILLIYDANEKIQILDVENKEVTYKLTVDKAISKSALVKLVGDVIETANKLNSYNGPFIKVKTAIIDGLLKRKEENEKEMKGNQKEPKLTYALDAFGKMVYIGSVDRGLSCHCRCPNPDRHPARCYEIQPCGKPDLRVNLPYYQYHGLQE